MFTVALAAVSLLLLVAGPVTAQQNPYPPPPGNADTNCPPQVNKGTSPTCVSKRYDRRSTVQVQITGAYNRTDTAQANPGGVVTYKLDVPCDAATADATITFTGTNDGAPVSGSDTFAVRDRGPCGNQGGGGNNQAQVLGRSITRPAAGAQSGNGAAAGAQSGNASLASGAQSSNGLAVTGGNLVGLAVVSLLLMGAGTAIVRNRRRTVQGD